MSSLIKLVVTDIDGTLMEMNGSLAQETIDVVKKMSEKGVKVVIATGRMYNAAKPVVQKLALDTPIICYQGAMIRDDSEIYFERNVDKKTALNIINDLRNYGAHINLYLRDRLIVEQDDKYIKEYAGDRFLKYEVVPDLTTVVQDATKLLAINEDATLVTQIRDEMRVKYPYLNIVKSTDYYCEFVNKEADKGYAIDFLAQKWNLKKQEILAIGDQDNDVEMIKAAGLGVAMGNCSPKLRDSADFICPTVQEFGFVQAMEKFVL